MRIIIIPVAGLLLSIASMGRARVDPQQAQKACDAVRSGQLSLSAAAKAYGVNKDALSRRSSGAMAMDAKVGPETVLRKAEEDAVEDAMIYASRHFLSFGRQQLIDAVRVLCLDGGPVPWDPDKGPGRSWLDGFMARHPALSERTTHIYEANRINENWLDRSQFFFLRGHELKQSVGITGAISSQHL
ncbi:unnamed protein product [Ectocarpus sp. CCAP 1310/34]|nr:unnamed protein product [Ectocarpus sp. CCAP 1310/34]